MNSIVRRSLFFGSSLILASCSPTSSDSSKAADPRVLVQQDINGIQGIDTAGIQTFDADHAHAFTKIFGGTTAADVKSYFDLRMHYFFTEDQLKDVYTNLTATSSVTTLGGRDDSGDGRAEVEAANIGMSIWLLGKTNGTDVTVNIGDQHIPVESSRVGIMEIGPGYRATIQDQNGVEHNIPSEVRQAVLIHEARHSDCTGGLTETDIANARLAKTSDDLQASLKNSQCGHLHTNCPAGHDLAGLAACDAYPWQAYSVESVYLDAVGNQLTGIDKRILEITRIDKESRYADFQELKLNQRGNPDMSSTNTIFPRPNPSTSPSPVPSPTPSFTNDPYPYYNPYPTPTPEPYGAK